MSNQQIEQLTNWVLDKDKLLLISNNFKPTYCYGPLFRGCGLNALPNVGDVLTTADIGKSFSYNKAVAGDFTAYRPQNQNLTVLITVNKLLGVDVYQQFLNYEDNFSSMTLSAMEIAKAEQEVIADDQQFKVVAVNTQSSLVDIYLEAI